MDHENEFRGSKNWGNELWVGLKWPKMAEKVKNSPVITVAAAAASPARPAAVGYEILPTVASGCPLPPWPARVAGGWPKVPPSVQSSTTRRWLNGSTCVPGLESFFLGFWELESCLGG